MIKNILNLTQDFLFPKSLSLLKLEALGIWDMENDFPRATPINPSCFALWQYKYPKVQELIWQIKYQKNSTLTDKVADILSDYIISELSERNPLGVKDKAILTNIPCSIERLLERGWNQSELLAKSVSKNISPDLEYKPNILEKTKHTSSQTQTLSKSERLTNLENSMRATESLSGATIVVVDDVYTTGATYTEAKRALKEAGAKEVLFFALAH